MRQIVLIGIIISLGLTAIYDYYSIVNTPSGRGIDYDLGYMIGENLVMYGIAAAVYFGAKYYLKVPTSQNKKVN